MKTKNKILLGLLILGILLLAWSPWLNNQKIHDQVFQEKAQKDGSFNICDYTVKWIPFGRWVASCEGGYIVTFWGEIV